MTASDDGSTPGDGAYAKRGTVLLDHDAVEKIMLALSMTDDNEMSCAEVFALLDEYADGTVVDAADAEVLLPLIEKHLEICADCQECYDMLHKMVEPKDDLPITET